MKNMKSGYSEIPNNHWTWCYNWK